MEHFGDQQAALLIKCLDEGVKSKEFRRMNTARTAWTLVSMFELLTPPYYRIRSKTELEKFAGTVLDLAFDGIKGRNHERPHNFEIEKGDVISVVGSGGKTSIIEFISQELRMEFSVAVTTTTKMFPFETKVFENHFESIANFTDFADRARQTGNVESFFGGRDSEGRCLPLSDETFARMAEAFDVVLIEADGAAGKSLKRPRVHEPVVPSLSNKAIWIVGADVIGKTFSDELVFKPDTFMSAGFDLNQQIDFQNLGRLYTRAGDISTNSPVVKFIW